MTSGISTSPITTLSAAFNAEQLQTNIATIRLFICVIFNLDSPFFVFPLDVARKILQSSCVILFFDNSHRVICSSKFQRRELKNALTPNPCSIIQFSNHVSMPNMALWVLFPGPFTDPCYRGTVFQKPLSSPAHFTTLKLFIHITERDRPER